MESLKTMIIDPVISKSLGSVISDLTWVIQVLLHMRFGNKYNLTSLVLLGGSPDKLVS